jgi:hypothetical protein
MNDRLWVRLAAVAGVVFVILIIVQGPVLDANPPTLSDSAQKVFAYFSAHHARIKLSAAFYALAMSAVLFWIPALYGVLRRAMSGFGGLAIGAAAGTVLAAAMTVSTAAIEATLACRVGELGPTLARVLYTLQNFTQGGILFGLAVMLGCSAAVSLQSGLFGRWFGPLSVVLAVASIVGGSAVAYANNTAQAIGVVMLALDTLWVLFVSVMLLRKPQLALAMPA